MNEREKDYQNGIIKWKILLKSPPETVFEYLTTDEKRKLFWAEYTKKLENNQIYFKFPGGYEYRGKILENIPNKRFELIYFGDTKVTFTLTNTPSGGTILEVQDIGISQEFLHEVYAGWVSVLMALKGALDFGIDLRNHNDEYIWNKGYCDN